MTRLEEFFKKPGSDNVTAFVSGEKAAKGTAGSTRRAYNRFLIGSSVVLASLLPMKNAFSQEKEPDTLSLKNAITLVDTTAARTVAMPVAATDTVDVSKISLYGSKREKENLNNAISELKKSSLGRALLKSANDQGYTLAVTNEGMQSGDMTLQGLCIKGAKKIQINPSVGKTDMVFILAHELEHARHTARLPEMAYLNGYSFFAAGRAMEASATAAQCFVAYELKDVNPAVYKRARSMKRNEMDALEKSFENAPTDTLAAMRGAFYAYFNNKEWVDNYDRSYVSAIRAISSKPTETQKKYFGGQYHVETVLSLVGQFKDTAYFTGTAQQAEDFRQKGMQMKRGTFNDLETVMRTRSKDLKIPLDSTIFAIHVDGKPADSKYKLPQIPGRQQDETPVIRQGTDHPSGTAGGTPYHSDAGRSSENPRVPERPQQQLPGGRMPRGGRPPRNALINGRNRGR